MMHQQQLTRRQIFRLGAAGLLAPADLPGCGGRSSAPGSTGLPRGLVLSCSSLAFSDRTWQEALEAIKALGFHHADLAMFEGWTHVNPSELTDPETHGRTIAEVCRRVGVDPIAIHANFRPDGFDRFPGLTTPDAEARKIVLEHYGRVIKCAAAAAVPLVNVQPGRLVDGLPRQQCLDNAAAVLLRMREIAEQAGVILTYENHAGSIAEQPEDALFLLQQVPRLKLDYDPSHVVCLSVPVERTWPLLPYVAHIGIRNAIPGSFNQPVREGNRLDYDVDVFLDAFRRAGVNAYVSVEYTKPETQSSIPMMKAVLEAHGIPSG